VENMEHGIMGRLLGAKIICFVVVASSPFSVKKLNITLHEWCVYQLDCADPQRR